MGMFTSAEYLGRRRDRRLPLAGLVSLALVWPAVFRPGWAGETEFQPAAALLELAKNTEAPPVAKLKEPYLQLQWLRLTGQAPCPKNRNLEAAEVRFVRSPALDDAEKAKLKAWFDARPKFRERFLLALDPFEDDLPNAARVALRLHEKFPKDCETFENLLLAFAVVWDNEPLLRVLNTMNIPELDPETVKICSAEEAFGWYVNNQPRLCPWFKTTPWRLLLYVAADTTPLAEREWIFNKYHVFRSNLGTVYSELVYDESKLKDDAGKLAGREYTLANLKQYGGVCRDQAYYARAVCAAFGLPAYMASATGNAALRHAWVGWVVNEPSAGYKLLSHGRYEYDKYFTANIMDPQTGYFILDYLVGIEAKGLSGREQLRRGGHLLPRVPGECFGAAHAVRCEFAHRRRQKKRLLPPRLARYRRRDRGRRTAARVRGKTMGIPERQIQRFPRLHLQHAQPVL